MESTDPADVPPPDRPPSSAPDGPAEPTAHEPAATDPASDPAADPATAGAGDPSSGGAGRDLPVAIGVGIGMAVGFLGTLLWHPVAFLVYVGLFIGVALTELDGAFGVTKQRPPTAAALIALPVMLIGAYLVGPEAINAGVIGGLLLGFVITMATNDRGQTVSRMAALGLMLIWVNATASILGLLLQREDGPWYVMAIIALTVTNDIGAFAFGRSFGTRPLAPSISPKKTWEGLLGGLATTMLMAGLVTATLVPGVDVVGALALAVVVVLAATAGDLAESLVKRDLKIKDLGRLLPEHGGVMDRVDAMLFALPAGYAVLVAVGI